MTKLILRICAVHYNIMVFFIIENTVVSMTAKGYRDREMSLEIVRNSFIDMTYEINNIYWLTPVRSGWFS